MKNLLFIISLFTLICAAKQTYAINWAWLGASPSMYNADDGQWYFMGVIDDAIWLFPTFPGGEFVLLAPAFGNTPTTLTGQQLSVTIPVGTATFDFISDTEVIERNEDGSSDGTYSYTRKDDNTAILVLLSNAADGDIVFVEMTFTSPTTGRVDGRSTSIADTEIIQGSYTIAPLN